MTSNNTGCSDVVIGFFVILVVGSCVSRCTSNRSNKEAYTDSSYTSSPPSSEHNSSVISDATEAWIYTKEIIRRDLKSPSTAKFEFAGHRGVKYLGDNRYSFSSYVDSQNSFGATVRTYFSGIIRATNSRWVMEELNYNEPY